MAVKYISPSESATFKGITLQPPAIPVMPKELFALAAAIPEQAVPCPGSALLSIGLLSLSPKS